MREDRLCFIKKIIKTSPQLGGFFVLEIIGIFGYGLNNQVLTTWQTIIIMEAHVKAQGESLR